MLADHFADILNAGQKEINKWVKQWLIL
jgi:hypothetical protein